MDALRGMKLVFKEKPQLIIPKKTKEGEDKEGEDGMEASTASKEDEGKGKDEGQKGEDWKSVLDLNDEEGKKEGDNENASDDRKVRRSPYW